MITCSLQGLNKEDIELVGGKAASLGELIKAGIPVPPGFVITTEVYKKFFRSQLPIDVKKEVFEAFDRLGAEKVAVRSSSVAEDSPKASWAGQFETFLNVEKGELFDKIRECWNSGQSERARAYAAQQGVKPEKILVAVVVQKMVDSKVAGVMFTVNPVNKDPNEMMIEAAPGLGEAIVQGQITPDNFLVSKKDLKIKAKDIRVKSGLSDAQVKKLATLGMEIERHYNFPQDIEWAFAGSKFYVLQSRPITTLQKEQKPHTAGASEKVLLVGIAGSPGIEVGKVRVVSSLKDLKRVKKGEILVAKKTTPDFVEAFGKAVAVVTDLGGITSHAAIVSRELGIPAVIGTGKATALLKSGDLITVDGVGGKVYKGKVKMRPKEEDTKSKIPKLTSTGDDIDDFIQAVTSSVNDPTELWPLKPGQFMPYIDLDQSLDLYEKVKTIKRKEGSLNIVAQLIEHPTKVRMFLVNSGVSGMKAANKLGIGDIKTKDQIKFTKLLFEVVKHLSPDDPFCLKGTNRVWSEKKVDQFISKNKWGKLGGQLRSKVNLLSVNLNAYIWAFFWDYFFDAGVEHYGPYHVQNEKLKEGRVLLISDYFDLKPKEIWPLAKEFPYQSIVLSQIYDVDTIFFRIGNRIANQDQLIGKNKYFSLKVDGKEITSKEEIVGLTKKLEEMTKKQADYVNRLEDMDKIRKGAMLSYYSWRPLYEYFKEGWYPEKRVEETIKTLGDEFLVENKDEKDRTEEEKRKFFDPRNNFL